MVPEMMREPFWARPSATVLPACLGLLGCGLVWRDATGVLGAPAGIAGLWLGATLALLGVCLVLYGRRIARRPASLRHDLRMPATRGAVSTGSMALMLAGAALAPLWLLAAWAAWLAGVVLHGILGALLVRELAAMPPDGRPATASLMVPFAGFLAAPIGGVPLGLGPAAAILFWSGMAAWLVLLPLVLRHLLHASSPPPPVREQTAALLMPPALAAVGLETLDPGNPGVAWLYGLAALTLVGLLLRLRWMTGGGWSPGWAALSFPLASFAWASLIIAGRVQTVPLRLAAAVALTAASLVTLYVSWRLAKAWVTGKPALP